MGLSNDLSTFTRDQVMSSSILLMAIGANGFPPFFEQREVSLMARAGDERVYLVNYWSQYLSLNDSNQLDLMVSCLQCNTSGWAKEIGWTEEYGICGKCMVLKRKSDKFQVEEIADFIAPTSKRK